MLLKRLIRLFLFLFVILSVANAQTSDTLKSVPQAFSVDTTVAASQGSNYAEDDPPFLVFLLFFAFGFFLLCLICVGIGLAVAAFGISFLLAFVSLGILSMSFAAGFYRRSLGAGFRVFLLLCSMVARVGLATGGAFLLNALFSYHLSNLFLFAVGISSGIVSGLVLGQLLFVVFRKLFLYYKEKLQLNHTL